MVFDFLLFISRPSSMEWSLIFMCFHIDALYKSNGHRSFISRPSTKAMIIDLSYRGPLQSNGHQFFISRPSSMEWSLIFICFLIEALYKSNGQRSFESRSCTKAMVIDLSYRGPLQKQWSSIFHIEALCKAMVVDLSYQDLLRWNGH